MKEVLAVCTDLFFAVKIGDAAKRAGVQARFFKSGQSLLEAARHGAAMIVVDLNCREVDGAGVIRELKADPACAATPITAFVSHVQSETIREARAAGCDRVLARSAFVKEIDPMMQALKAPALP